MGYTSTCEGEIIISPPITAKELRAHAELLESHEYARGRPRDAYIAVQEEIFPTDDGELTKKSGLSIVVNSEDESWTRYNLEASIQEIVHAFPDRQYTGRITCLGEDGDQWAFIVREGKVKEIRPQIVWPEEDE